MKNFLKLAGTANILAAILLLGGWFSIGFFMWDEISKQDFAAMVLNRYWIPANLFFLLATFLLLPGVIGLYLHLSDRFGKLYLAGFISTLLAVVWYCCIQFYETLFWPLIAAASPDLFEAVGFSATNRMIFFQLIASGIPWTFGFVVMGYYLLRSNIVAKWQSLVFIAGALLFGVGMAFPVRTLGVLLFAVGLIRVGHCLRSSKS